MRNKTREQFTSKYYGVRCDYRPKTGKTWYRAELMVNGTVIRLGAFLDEKEAAFAFNYGFEKLQNGTHIIKNLIEIPSYRMSDIMEYIDSIFYKKNLVFINESSEVDFGVEVVKH